MCIYSLIMEAKKGGTGPILDNKRRVAREEGEHAPEIMTQGNLTTHEGTFHPSMQDKRILPPPEKDASFGDRRASSGHPGGEEELAPPDGGWGWMVAFGAFVITVSAPPPKRASLGILWHPSCTSKDPGQSRRLYHDQYDQSRPAQARQAA